MGNWDTDFIQKIQECLHIAGNFNDAQRENLASFWHEVAGQFDRIFNRTYLSEASKTPLLETSSGKCDPRIGQLHSKRGEPSAVPNQNIQVEENIGQNVPKKEVLSRRKTAPRRRIKPEIQDGESYDYQRSSASIKEGAHQPRRSTRKSKPSKLYADDYVTSSSTSLLKATEGDFPTADGTTEADPNGRDDNVESIEPSTDEQTDRLPDSITLVENTVQDKILFRTVNPDGENLSFDENQVNHIVRVQMSRNNRDIEVYVTRDDPNRTTPGKDDIPSDEVKTNATNAPPDHVYFSIPESGAGEEEEREAEDASQNSIVHEKLETGPDENVGREILTGHDDTVVEKSPESDVRKSSEVSEAKKSPVTRKTVATKKKTRGAIKKHADGRYHCPECDKQIANYSNLKVHMRIHSGEKPYKCSECGKSFSTITNMTRHERTTHANEKRWQCEQCQKRFTEKKSLIVHQRIHSGEKPFECKICNRRFAQSGTLKTHIHCHLGFKGHLCDFCGKSFRQKSQLHIHQLRHGNIRNFKCSVCPKAFVSKVELSRHEMSHSGARPFLCSYCPKTFTRHQYLKQHLLIHTSATPYLCKDCGQTFLDQHVQCAHVCPQPSFTMTTTDNPVTPGETYIVLPHHQTLLMQDLEELGKSGETSETTETQVIQLPTMVVEENAGEGHPGPMDSQQSVLDINQLGLALKASGVKAVVTSSDSTIALSEPHLVSVRNTLGLQQEVVMSPPQHQASTVQIPTTVPIHVEELSQEEDIGMSEQYIVIQSQGDIEHENIELVTTTHEESVATLSPAAEVSVITDNQHVS